MTEWAKAVAHPNIALAKYWGKLARPGNYPAVPSLSVTLAGLATTTAVRFRDDLAADLFTLDGARPRDASRVVELLSRVREMSGERRFAEVVSANDFPTASGLASSASGFAALAFAATRAAGLDWGESRVSDLARQSSASAARSVFGGFVELTVNADSAAIVAPPDRLDLRVVVAVTSEDAKGTGSTDGMRRTAEKSPFYAAWLEEAPKSYARLRAALLAKDFGAVGELAEASALAMHASAIAAGTVYFAPATLAALHAVRVLRSKGVAVFATIDAGPHLKALALGDADAATVKAHLLTTPGVLRVIDARPGEGARVGEA